MQVLNIRPRMAPTQETLPPQAPPSEAQAELTPGKRPDASADPSVEAPSATGAESHVARSTLKFPVVGIGASAGGLAALLRFFEHCPSDTGMAFVVILHLSPQHESNADAVLQRATRMPVLQVQHPVRIEPDKVYVIPPSRQLSMNDSQLRLTELERPRGRQVAVDTFFRTLAEAHQERAFCIILSGTDSDGAVGIRHVKEHGGVTLAQQPEDAEYDGMPRSAIATGMVDLVLPAADMPAKLVRLWDNARRITLPEAEGAIVPAARPPTPSSEAEAEEALRDIIIMVRSRTGHDFHQYKRATVLRRIERRLQVNALPDLRSYRDLLRDHVDETSALLKDLLISVTAFFRDREAYEALDRLVTSKLFDGRPANEQVRVWVPGCATGEEAYSVAILLLEQAAAMPKAPEIQVFATDINEDTLNFGRNGLYPGGIIADVAPARLRQFFVEEQGQFRIRKSLREKVLFATHNVLRDPPFSRLDLICCRNLLIYLDREVQSRVFEMFHFALRPGGYLWLGTSESADSAAQLFGVIDQKNRIYRANTASRNFRFVPTLAVPPGGKVPWNPAAAVAPREKRKPGYAEIHRQLLEQYAPPSVLIDSEAKVVHLSDRAGRFLRYVGGAPSHNLLALVHPDLRLDLRAALSQAVPTGKSVEARHIRIERDGQVGYVNMEVRAIHLPEGNLDLTLVLFDEVDESISTGDQPATESHRDAVVRHLEGELVKTREQLQATIEQHEISTAELKASNEELQSINEELRSATEELETSKEELQSINEELTTVNYELKLKVEETVQINDDLQNLIASTDFATLFVDGNLKILRYTPRTADLFNIIPADLGRSLLDITHKLDYADLAKDAAETFNALRSVEREVNSADNRWYIARILPYRTSENHIEGVILTFIDITQRHQAEERLKKGEERMRLVAESTKDYAIMTFDREGRFTSWNRGAERIFGYSEEEVLGQKNELIFTPVDRQRGEPDDELRRARLYGRAEDERWHVRKDGSTFYCSGILSRLDDGETGTQGFAKIARDLTGIKREQERRDAQLFQERVERAEAQAKSNLKDEFLAVMSHELKHPLNLIHVNAELLARLPEVRNLPAVARAAETIRRSVIGQAKIIDDLLDLSRMHTGKLTLNRAPVDWVVVVKSIVDAVREDAAAKRLTMTFEPGTASLILFADPVRVEQIVWNLISNAMKFTPNGGTIKITLRQHAGFGTLRVEDNGYGIAPDFLPHIFDMFRQAALRTTCNESGLGIGLALVRQLVDVQGGTIEAASEGLGKGTTFTVSLPLHANAGQDASATAKPDGRCLANMRVLMVEDTPDTLDAFGELLRAEGARFTAAHGGADALRLTQRENFDLILSDIGMPDMDGYELIRQLRRQKHTRSLPAIALTGFGRQDDARRALKAGFNAHLSKPVTLPALIDAINAIVDRPGVAPDSVGTDTVSPDSVDSASADSASVDSASVDSVSVDADSVDADSIALGSASIVPDGASQIRTNSSVAGGISKIRP